jgi:hypothetical protein
MARRASGNIASPAGVSTTPRALRSNSLVPTSVSNARIDIDNPDCTMFVRRAARVNERSSATATNARVA